MSTLKNIILTSGPRGSGKSTYSKNFASKNQNFRYLSRDKLLIELFGTTSLNPYEGGHYYASKIFFKNVQETIENSFEGLNLVIDYWNGDSDSRENLVKKFRSFGADKVYCLKFMTSKDFCLDWFFKKEDSKGYTKRGVGDGYDLYHKWSKKIEEDGFDKVYLINPLQLELF